MKGFPGNGRTFKSLQKPLKNTNNISKELTLKNKENKLRTIFAIWVAY